MAGCPDTYLSVSAPSEGLYKEKGSKFISFLFPIETPGQAKIEIDRLKKEYYDARHHCFAYRLGLTGDVWRINDDGEPSSTAGKPILGQILSNSLSDILIVVVRYFGGIKLGVPGLINAYRSAAADAIAHTTVIKKTAGTEMVISFGYPVMNDIMKIVKNHSLAIFSQSFDTECEIIAKVPLSEEDSFSAEITKAGGTVSPKNITFENQY